jgi:hypothetical protein
VPPPQRLANFERQLGDLRDHQRLGRFRREAGGQQSPRQICRAVVGVVLPLNSPTPSSANRSIVAVITASAAVSSNRDHVTVLGPPSPATNRTTASSRSTRSPGRRRWMSADLLVEQRQHGRASIAVANHSH